MGLSMRSTTSSTAHVNKDYLPALARLLMCSLFIWDGVLQLRNPAAAVDYFTSKGGGHVRVIVVTDEAGNSKLGFDYPDGPVKPRPEKLPEPRRAKAKRRSPPKRKPPGGGDDGPPRRGIVPKVPLVKV